MPTPFDTHANSDSDLNYSSDEQERGAVVWAEHRVRRFPQLDSPPAAHKLSYDNLEDSTFKGFNVLPASDGSTPQPIARSQRGNRGLLAFEDDMHTLPETNVFPREFFRTAIPIEDAETTEEQHVITQLVDLGDKADDTKKPTIQDAVRESEHPTARANRLRAIERRKRKRQDRNAANMRQLVVDNLQEKRQVRLKAELSSVQEVPDWFFDDFE